MSTPPHFPSSLPGWSGQSISPQAWTTRTSRVVTTDLEVGTKTFFATVSFPRKREPLFDNGGPRFRGDDIVNLARSALTTNSISPSPYEGEVRWGYGPTPNPKNNHTGDPA
jgi:hypothetical protein